VRNPADSFKFQVGGTNQEVTQAKLGSDGKGYFNGGVQATGAGYSQSVSVTGAATNYQPGDLLAIDPSGSRSFMLASTPYSTLVAGVYASTPGAVVTVHSLDDTSGAGEVPLAVTGIVPCYASAENGAIQPGDLLVSSSTPGYVMKGTDPTQMLGAVVGKALDPLPAGTGTILILVGLK